ncbi:putative E3 ubiquitin-protein ligase RFWD3 [Cocos nucifera]|uniref:RING-type E3 ubiquitin transferase n=1 Tax=Cocos nucifera TaxID=13894 RepID=A0A8K0IGF3_COCNU|nr:putative E3 ubiquitin-protein ligase RFWD3 [Cocos nucifera]
MASNNPYPSYPGVQPEERAEDTEDEDEDDEDYEPYLEVLDSEEEEAMAASLVLEEDEAHAYLPEAAAVIASMADGRTMVDEVGTATSTDLFEVSLVEVRSSVERPSGGGDGGSEGEEDEGEGEEEGGDGVEKDGGGRGECGESIGAGKTNGIELDRSISPNCPICFEMWTSDGPHRVSCIPCGHVYGRSCLERWLDQCGKKTGKCPQCNRNFKHKEIINLYAPLIVVPNDDLRKELHSLREKNKSLKLEKAQLLEEISKHKKRTRDREGFERQKMACLEHSSSGDVRGRLFENIDVTMSAASAQTSLENIHASGSFCGGGLHWSSFVLQNELALNGARVMGIDVSGQILIVSRKAPGVGGEHVLSKISMLVPNGIDEIHLPPDTKAIRDLCFLPNGLALLASLGKKLLLFSVASSNVVIKYDLPGPAWSCSRDINSPYHMYAGLQNGMLLVFDVRQTAQPMISVVGLSRHPVHTVHSIGLDNGAKKVLTASSLGPCIWEIVGSSGRPTLLPEMENQGVCISLACGSSCNDIVASFRPKVELPSDGIASQTSLSPSLTLSNSGKFGSHVLMKRVDGSSFRRHEFGYGNVSELRMSKSAIICRNGKNPLFAYGDESTYGVCLWDLPSFQVHTHLKPHQHPILDLKYQRNSTGPGFLGCISEDRLQLFTCY